MWLLRSLRGTGQAPVIHPISGRFDSDSNERSSSLAPLLIEENEPLRQRQENAILQIAVNATRAKLTIKKGACQVSVYLVREDQERLHCFGPRKRRE